MNLTQKIAAVFVIVMLLIIGYLIYIYENL